MYRMKAHWLSGKSIRFKLLLNFVLIIVLSIAALSLLGTTLYTRSIEEETNSYTKQMMHQVKNNIQMYLGVIDNILYYLSEDEALAAFFALPAGQSADEALNRSVGRALSRFEARHSEIAGILAVNGSGEYVSNTMRPMTRDLLSGEKWFKEAVASGGAIRYISRPIGRNIAVDQHLSADQVLTVTKAISAKQNESATGVVLIDIKLDLIQQMIQSVSLGKSGFIYVVDERDEVVYSPVNPIVYRIKGDWLQGDADTQVRLIGDRNYQLMSASFSGMNWRVVGVFPLDEPLKVVKDVQFYTVLIALITLLFAFGASWYFTHSIVRPVGQLQSLMKKVEGGELHLRFLSATRDEIGQLGDSFNNMVQEIENLINLVYTEQREKREAELKILQAQIKPHFLYNTLDTIQWMAQEREAQDIVDIVAALTTLFRISLNKGNETVELREEIRHAESYLFIQMARYEDKLTYDVDVSSELLAYTVPKIILQPLIENCIYHGIKTKRGVGHIRIAAIRTDDSLELLVADDGVGIEPRRLVEINEYLENERHDGRERGYGLYNVNERIKLSYGQRYGLAITSVKNQGTTFVVKLPIQHL